jgi:serine protease AprX
MGTFSAYGTTESGFAKPELVAPGRNLISLLASTNATAFVTHPKHRVDDFYFRMSGTSMSAPVVSGAVALLLQAEPNLTPDQIKHRLVATANHNWPGYDAAKAGAGTLDVYTAVYSSTVDSANQGITPCAMLSTGEDAIAFDSVSWNSVSWNSVSWNSVSWNSVSWNSVSWNSVSWNSLIWNE